jgi:hypothetical protein
MKKQILYTICIVYIVLFALLSSSSLLSNPKSAESYRSADSIAGKYNLYDLKKSDKIIVGVMVITSWNGNTFLIRGEGQGWIGYGKVDGNKGYYDWKFDDGRTGRTNIEINSEGTLNGFVSGAGINWVYFARRS